MHSRSGAEYGGHNNLHTHTYTPLWWLGGVEVECWIRDQEVAGSTSTTTLFGQQPWASCSHLMCLCSPSSIYSITWYLARAFMLKAPYCWQRNRVQWTRGYCRAVLRWFTNCIEPRHKSSALPFTYLLTYCVRLLYFCVIRVFLCSFRTLILLVGSFDL